MAIKIGHASNGENGGTGNVAGDQTGKEVCISTWYSNSWGTLIRCKDSGKAEKMAQACEAGCKNDKIGYDMDQRNTLNTQAKKVDYNLSKIITACECDCSSFMTVCAQAAGINVPYSSGNAPTTSTMKDKFNSTGMFQVLTESKYLTSDKYLKRGDILVRSGKHTIMALEYGAEAATKYTVRYNANGGTGTMADTIVTYNVTSYFRANTYAKAGNTFIGWTNHRKSDDKWYYKGSNGAPNGWYKAGSQPAGYQKLVYKDKNMTIRQSAVDADIVTLYAQWKPHTYIVRYNANGGVGSMEDTVVTYDVASYFRANIFVMEGQTFIGWTNHRESDDKWYYRGIDGLPNGWYKTGSQPSGYEKLIYKDKNMTIRQSEVDGDIVTLYAQWESQI